MIYQIIANMIIYLLGTSIKSKHRETDESSSRNSYIHYINFSSWPYFRKFVFRKVIFGEIYNMIRANKTIKFLIAGIVRVQLFLALPIQILLIIYFGMV